MIAPLTNEARSEHRNAATWATSSGCPARWSDAFSYISGNFAPPDAPMISVSMNPGQRALARIPWCPYSADADLVTEMTPALAALYTDVDIPPDDAFNPPTDDQLTIDPPPAAIIAGMPYFIPRRTPRRSTFSHGVVVVHGDLGDRFRGADAGHVQHRVDPAELRDRGVEQRSYVGFQRHVAVHGQHTFTDLDRGVLLGPADVRGHDLRALGDEQSRRRLGHSRTRAGDHRDLAVEQSHHVPPVNTGRVSQPRTVEVGASRACAPVDLPLREALQYFFQRHPSLEPRERGAEAVVDAVAERELLADRPVDVETVAVGIAPVVTVGGPDEEQHGAACGHRPPVELHVARDVSADVRRGRLEAEDLLDRVGDEREIVDELATLVRVVGQDLARPPDQTRRRLVAGTGDHVQVREELGARQPARGPGLVLELGVQQLGHEVVGRVIGPPVDVLGEQLAAREIPGEPLRLARLGAQRRVGVLADRLLVLFGDPEQHADHPHGHLRAEVGDEVEPVRALEPIQTVDAELPDLRLQRVHLPRREHTRQQTAMNRVRRRVLEDEDARRHLHVRLDQFEDAAASGDIGRRVDETALHVVEAAHREEVVRLVVVERRFFAQPPEHRVRIRVDVDVVGVVVDVRRLGRRHEPSPFSILRYVTPISWRQTTDTTPGETR